MAKFTSKTYGDWKAIAKKLEEMPKNVDAGMKEALMKTTLKGERIAVMHVRNQDLKWRPLSKKYRSRKVSEGKSDKILIATSTYIQSITSVVVNGHGFIGVKRGTTAPGSDEDIANIAMIHEFGSLKRNIRPRKLWKPTMLELIAWIKSSGVFVKHVKNKL